MRAFSGPDCVNGDRDTAVSTILEPGRHRESGDELAVDLGLGRARANGAPSHEVGRVLWSDCICIRRE